MNRLVIAATVLLSLLFSTTVSAHSTIENSSPSDGETVQDQISEVSMQFNTSIDPMSTFTLIDGNGNEVPAETSVSEKVLSGTVASPLNNGEYTVEWNIIGADGHPITGAYSFTVDVPEAEGTEDTNTVSDKEDETEAVNPAAADTESTEKDSSTNFLLIGILVLAAILLITLFTLGRKNRK